MSKIRIWILTIIASIALVGSWVHTSESQLRTLIPGTRVYSGDQIMPGGGGAGTIIPSGVIHINTTAVGTDADTVEKDLLTYSLPANSLSANGKGVRIRAWGTTAGNANNKSIRLKFGATATMFLVGIVMNNQNWTFETDVWRTGAATQDAIATGSRANISIGATFTNPTEDVTGAIIIKLTGENAVAEANDIVAEGIKVEFLN